MVENLCAAVDVLFAPDLAAAFKERIRSPNLHMPAPGTLSKYRFYVDTAHMLLEREQHEAAEEQGKDFRRFLCADASRLGEEWLNMRVVSIPNDRLRVQKPNICLALISFHVVFPVVCQC